MCEAPTLCNVKVVDISELGQQIQEDKDPEYLISMVGRTFFVDGVTEVSSPYHQFKSMSDGLIAKTAVYWPENMADEIVSSHCLHLAMEFYVGLRLTGKLV